MHDHHINAHRVGLAAPERLPHHDDHPGLAPLGTAAAPHTCLSPPHKDESPRPASAEGFKGQGREDGLDCAGNLAGNQAAVAEADKGFATQRAHLALHGYELHAVGDGVGGTAYIVHRWCVSRTLHDMAAVAEFAARVGAAP